MSYEIQRARQSQPIDELKRKAGKAVSRSNLWTVEELDYAKALGAEMHKALIGLFDDAPRPKPTSDRMTAEE